MKEKEEEWKSLAYPWLSCSPAAAMLTSPTALGASSGLGREGGSGRSADGSRVDRAKGRRSAVQYVANDSSWRLSGESQNPDQVLRAGVLLGPGGGSQTSKHGRD